MSKTPMNRVLTLVAAMTLALVPTPDLPAAPPATAPDLDLGAMVRPIPPTAVFSEPGFDVWCGTAVRGDDGKCHLFYSRWPRELTHKAWVTHSEIAHAIGDGPLGPFKPAGVILPARGRAFWDGMCTHNPTVLRAGGKYYLYYMGNTGDGVVRQPLNFTHRNNQRIGVAVADKPEGPWKRFDKPVIDVSPDDDAPDALMVSNPAVCQRPDGTFLMVYKAVGKKDKLPGGGPVVHLTATSPGPTGPFTKQLKPIFTKAGVKFPAEDPFLWHGGDRYYAIVKDNAGYFTAAGYALVLFESPDGLDWKPAAHPLVTSPKLLKWADGIDRPVTALERPQLYFEDGRPTALLCAAADRPDRDGSFNIQIPLRPVGDRGPATRATEPAAGTPRAASELPAPAPLWPRDRMTMTDVASFFRWTPVAGCTEYDVQIARDREFQTLYKEKRTKNARYHEDCYFPREILPPGDYWWRVRAAVDGREGPWSPARAVAVNDDHAVAAELVRPISPAHPIFLMRNRAWDPRARADHLGDLFPAEVGHAIVVDDVHLADATSERPIERARKYQELGLDFVVWNNRARVPLCQLEYFFQTFSHCIGTAEGEQFGGWGWEKGPEGNFSEEDYLNRAWVLCGKYGRSYFWGEGENGRYLWTTIAKENRGTFARYGRNIVPMFKSTNAYASPHSVGAVEGLMVSGYVENCGYWADEWVWPGGGFGKLGEVVEGQEASRALRRKYGTKQCPWVYDIQMWLMGITSGSTAFQLESAHQWTADGDGAEQYRRFFLPFVSAVVKHHLIPSRQAFLDVIKLAVDCDYEKAKQRNGNEKDPNFAFLNRLYRLDQSWYREIIPNDGRYGFVCLLPPGAKCLNERTRVVPQAELLDPAKAVESFDAAYPRRFRGDAFMWECDGTVIVTNSNENRDADQRFEVPLDGGPVRGLDGTIGVHQYLVGKVAADGSGFWFQANGEHPDRPITLELMCAKEPRVTLTPQAAKVAARWDQAAGRFRLTLSVKDGPVECDVGR